MACEFTMKHRVEFSDTDMAGIMHFAGFFRFMERTEHAFFRSLGFSIHMEEDGKRFGWPRVHASCDYKRPLRFEDEVEVRLVVREKRERSLSYDFIFRMAGEPDGPEVARGALTVVCVAKDAETGQMRAVPMPERFAALVEVAPGEQGG